MAEHISSAINVLKWYQTWGITPQGFDATREKIDKL